MKKIFSIGMLMMMVTSLQAQNQKKDTVIIKLANSSQVVFTIEDRNDIELLKHYDFQSLFNDIIEKIEMNDTSRLVNDTTEAVADNTKINEEDWSLNQEYEDKDDDDDDDEWNDEEWGHHGHRTRQSFNFDLGMNNYLSKGKFPDGNNELYTVRPWGSWYVGLNSIQRTRLSKKMFLEWGLGVSWYNFKFQNDKTKITKDDTGVIFTEDQRDVDFVKSKLTVTYLNASLIPVIDFSGSNKKPRVWDGDQNGFRFGFGPYAGYRIDSYTKMKYEENGDVKKDHDHDNFYLENFRYGVRAQFGYRSTDIFINYDLNDLFIAGKGPQLNAISFGVIF